jgi:hypothetical protein
MSEAKTEKVYRSTKGSFHTVQRTKIIEMSLTAKDHSDQPTTDANASGSYYGIYIDGQPPGFSYHTFPPFVDPSQVNTYTHWSDPVDCSNYEIPNLDLDPISEFPESIENDNGHYSTTVHYLNTGSTVAHEFALFHEKLEDFKQDIMEQFKQDIMEQFKQDIIEYFRQEIIEDLKQEIFAKIDTFGALSEQLMLNYQQEMVPRILNAESFVENVQSE